MGDMGGRGDSRGLFNQVEGAPVNLGFPPRSPFSHLQLAGVMKGHGWPSTIQTHFLKVYTILGVSLTSPSQR